MKATASRVTGLPHRLAAVAVALGGLVIGFFAMFGGKGSELTFGGAAWKNGSDDIVLLYGRDNVVFDASRGTIVSRYDSYRRDVTAAAWEHNGSLVLLGERDGTIHALSTEGKELARCSLPGPIMTLCCQGGYAYAMSENGSIFEWVVDEGGVTELANLGSVFRGASGCPKYMAAILAKDGRVRIVDLETGTMGCSYGADTARALTVDLVEGECFIVAFDGNVTSVAMSPPCKREAIYATNESGVRDASVSENGETLAVVADDERVVIVDLRGNRNEVSVQGLGEGFRGTSVTMSSQGDGIAVVSRTGVACVLRRSPSGWNLYQLNR